MYSCFHAGSMQLELPATFHQPLRQALLDINVLRLELPQRCIFAARILPKASLCKGASSEIASD